MFRILLAEDSHFSVRDLTRKLAQWSEPHELILARDGQTAIDLLDPECPGRLRRMPDLVILDLKMPRVDGLDVLAFIRETAAIKALPVVVLTTSDSPFDMDLAEVLQVNDYLLKGTDAHTVIRTVSRHVRREGPASVPANQILKEIEDNSFKDGLGRHR
jgi:chemotaxis family two-component system response regulator Rcp1